MPVLAAGGIVDGRGVAAALALGCDGAVLGTRLWASAEALGDEDHKYLLASKKVGPDQVIRTTVRDRIANCYSDHPWPEPYDSVGMVRNGTTDKWHGREGELDRYLSKMGSHGVPNGFVTKYRKAEEEGDHMVGAVLAGEGVGDIHTVESAFGIIQRINREAIDIITDLPKLINNPR